MAVITTTHNYQIELDYIGRYPINNLPTQPGHNSPYYIHIEYNTSWTRTELLGVVENCLWPHIHNELNVNSVSDTDIATLVDRLITETKFSTPPANLSGQGLTYGFQLTVTDLDSWYFN